MSFFTPLEGSALLYSKGLFTEAKLFVHNDMLYVQKGKGFIRLLSHERTSDASVSWRFIHGVSYREIQGLVLHNAHATLAT